jgi:Tol biopolymer transport system component
VSELKPGVLGKTAVNQPRQIARDGPRITRTIQELDVSPNGMFFALGSDRRGNQDLWLLPAAGGEMTQLTSDPTPDWGPRWSPDGKEIAFYAYRSGNRDIWVMPAKAARRDS